MTWQTIRTLTTQAAEGRADPGSHVGFDDQALFTIDRGRVANVEIRFDALTLVGSPSSVTFAVWRTSGGKVDRVATITIADADKASPTPVILDIHGEAIAVAVESFAGGTTPTVSGAVHARPVRL